MKLTAAALTVALLCGGCGPYLLDRLPRGVFTKGEAIAQWGGPSYEGLDGARGQRILSWRRWTDTGDRSTLTMWFDESDRMVRWHLEPNWTTPAWGY